MVYWNLEYAQPNPRYDDVLDAAPNTFEWIFREPETLKRLEPLLQTTFVDWLRHGQGVFHVVGKAGCGKSTLMKFLCERPETKAYLKDWAEPNRLVFSQYFFWKTDPLQNGFPALKRCILHGILKQAPELCEVLFPQHCELQRYDNKEYNEAISNSDVSKAFEYLMGSHPVLENLHICLFIDGLDEFDDQMNAEDFNDLAQAIQRWESHSNNRLKFCVSSRNYEAFTVFPVAQKIHLQNLTYNDIQAVVKDRLESHPEIQRQLKQSRTHKETEVCIHLREKNLCRSGCLHQYAFECLIENIIDAAEGVFLWVHLVLKDLRKCLDAGYSMVQLMNKVNELPKDLERFLVHMLDSVHRRHQQDAYSLFAILDRYTQSEQHRETYTRKMRFRRPFSISIRGASFFFHRTSLSHLKVGTDQLSLDDTDMCDTLHSNEVVIMTAEQLNDRCNGLLELRNARKYLSNERENPALKFTHRSIIEVLRKYLPAKLSEYHITDAILAHWVRRIVVYEIAIWFRQFTNPISFMTVKYQSCSYDFIEDKLIELLAYSTYAGLQNQPATMICLELIDHLCFERWADSCNPSAKNWQQLFKCGLEPFSVLLWAARSRPFEFVRWKLETSNFPRKGQLASRLLAATMSNEKVYLREDGNTSLKFLLTHGFMDEFLEPVQRRSSCPMRSLYDVHLLQMAQTLTIPNLTSTWDVVEICLDAGANPVCCFQFVKKDFNEPYQYRTNSELVCIMTPDDYEFPIRDTDETFWERMRANSPGTSLGRVTISLRQMVQYARPGNMDRLLELIDRNIAQMLEQEASLNMTMFEELPSPEILELEDYVHIPPVRSRGHLIIAKLRAYLNDIPYLERFHAVGRSRRMQGQSLSPRRDYIYIGVVLLAVVISALMAPVPSIGISAK
ncbi:hypothetical protein F5B20DRAFT_136672 [Whalleya microplaca]|nr:hypothetical protein F5B20DRAFT_136672 [Whalleya microplaca]